MHKAKLGLPASLYDGLGLFLQKGVRMADTNSERPNVVSSFRRFLRVAQRFFSLVESLNYQGFGSESLVGRPTFCPDVVRWYGVSISPYVTNT